MSDQDPHRAVDIATVASPEPADSDPYALSESAIREPPKTFRGALPYLGPGFILSASIVGSGELIATTIVGAKAGFVLMWFIIFSCLVKVAVQVEFGKRAISSGESTMASLNELPGPKFGKANWSIWTWLLLMIAKMMQVGGIVGGVVLAIEQFFPEPPGWVARVIIAYVVAVSVSLLVFRGYYLLIEKASLIMISAFTLFTFASLCVLQRTDMAISLSEFTSGLIPNIPAETAVLLVALGAFGITGVGGDEIMAYNYWLLEKGYARYTGPKNDSPEWASRAKGWIRIMYLDATLAMVAYTAMTVMFYLLGAAVLNRRGLVPESDELINTLGTMYTESLGPAVKSLFLIGALVVLYSTLFAALAAWTRMFTDAFARVGMFDFSNERSRLKAIGILAWLIPIGWATLFLFMGEPALMVILGGVATVVILVIVVFAALFFRYRKSDQRLIPSGLYDATLWVSSIAIVLVAAYGTYKTGFKVYESVVAWAG
ncbi:MAG: Nramp family divalent metal transporter [Planctomycetota bacterium]